MAGAIGLIQRHAAPDVGWHIEILALMNGRLALLESALGDNLKRELPLLHLRNLPFSPRVTAEFCQLFPASWQARER